MQTSSRSPFLTLHTEGALLPVDLLQRILASDKDLDGLSPEDYHLSGGEKLNEAINRAWNRLQGAWAAFQTSRGRLKEGDPGTTLTRERWLLPLFQELGYGRLPTAKVIEIEGKSYPISHTWGNAEVPVPIHLVGCGVELDKRQAGVSGASRTSPHSLMQELLNRDDTRKWGLVSNGLRLRVLRDNASLTRQAFLEFDLEAMFSGEVYADFAVLWLVCHQSRLEGSKPEDQWLERWSKVAEDQGTRALEGLRSGVEEAIIALGQGFLVHPANLTLRQRLKSGVLDRQQYFRQLLRLVYRLIFLFVAEDRDLLLLPDAGIAERQRYSKYYSTARLRHLAERQRGGRHTDLWQGFHLLTDLLAGTIPGGQDIGLPVLGGFLFSRKALPDLEDALVDNLALLNAVRSLAFTQEKNTHRAVDYKNLGSEELGSVYESLLELQPLLNVEVGAFQLAAVAGNERKTTGSYYTAAGLIKITLDSALDPVILQAILRAGSSVEMQIAALLALKICDPACGSGHFLIAAARRLARRIAQLRSGDEEPSPSLIRHALREVVAHCIYGVDINPMAIELCKVNLWLEALEPGKPLTFLDAHIKCGNSLVGVGPGMEVYDLVIPDEAFDPVTGDDKKQAAAVKRKNKAERMGQFSLDFHGVSEAPAEDYAARLRQVEVMPEDTPGQVAEKEAVYAALQSDDQAQQRRLLADLWTAAFFWRLQPDPNGTLDVPTQGEFRNTWFGKPSRDLAVRVQRLAEEITFFHWPLEYPDVFDQGGFNCILGNPPWERIKLQEEEFFTQLDPEIAVAPNKAARQKMINALAINNPLLATTFEIAKHSAECSSKFIRQSSRYPFTAFGDVNTYSVFSELARQLISSFGRLGIICPPGIASDDTTKSFFSDIMENQNLVSLIAFVNEKFIFQSVLHNFRFCILTISGAQLPVDKSDFVYECETFSDVYKAERHVALTLQDLNLLNPNTRTAPVFRSGVDAELNKKIYRRVPIFINENIGENSWGAKFGTMFHMANDSNYFSTLPHCDFVPLYEAKMMHQFNHRFGSFEKTDGERAHMLPSTPIGSYQDPSYMVQPCYWVPVEEVNKRLGDWDKGWLLGFREVTSKALERTATFTILPRVGIGHKIPLIFLADKHNIKLNACFLANTNSLVFDYAARQKINATSFSFFILKQLPVLPPSVYQSTDINYLVNCVLELIYTSYNLKPFAEDMGYHGDPFCWDEERRALLRAELDAYYARLYGLTRDELRYILDPQDVYGPDFPGETFRVLKEKEIKQHGEYRTRRLVLEAWDRLEGMGIGNPDGCRSEQPAALPPSIVLDEAKQEITLPQAPTESALPAVTVELEKEEPPLQPAFSDFGLYKCGICGKLAMGFDRQDHTQQAHQGHATEWSKVR
jgi:hypothetical protein